jgi:UDPglucose 6-dehydrogenase
MKITVFGSGYVGLTTAACLANLGHEVLCVDIDEKKIGMLSSGQIPFFEPGLDVLAKKSMERGNLKFTTDSKQAVEFGEVIFSCVGTPSKENGEADLSAVFGVARTIGQQMDNYKVIVNKSTVPPGTAREIKHQIETAQKTGIEFDIVANPEFLREGEAIRAFNYPDKIVIGTDSEKAVHIMKKVYTGRMRTYLPFVETDWETAELIKYASNSLLAAKISMINEIANICDRVGADIKMVSLALGLDPRIAPKFLNAGIGYGGSCFPKDVKALMATAKEKGYHAKLLEQVDETNERQKRVMKDKIMDFFNNNLRGKVFSILGLSFKPKTSDMREAPSIRIIQDLLAEGAVIKAYDPAAMDEAKKIFGDRITYCASIEQSIKDSSAIILLTEWDEFRNINFKELGKHMRERVVFDGRNIYEPEMVREEGFEYRGMGRQ